ncbi:ATP-binding cassette domain-containing protein [Conexibacter stalactiti]|uniref:ATP-binding cassette domain-containing protein n=1 Tax=Conexibacter stalactiti TaxID=1940611 RepID=A0ABU4HNJ4_9ACTN|nr:ATP-binding cassette domain-containing protein [Conexibacter stalactiti]MDW5594865.1 ATP-binding cassette domain-containing protein [Conexibacter stalactiti]MEC5035507.1 ATP-binding cassette domain-containing protein [Conexibacter stalactiti]
MSGPLLHGRGLTVRYGGVTAVNAVDLDLDGGRVTGLIGPNGAGKTSLVDAITGFAPLTGTLELEGRDVLGVRAHERAELGIARTWQGVQLFADLTVEENLRVALRRPGRLQFARDLLRVRGDGPDAVTQELLERFELDGVAERLPNAITHVQRVVTGLARAVAVRPRVLLVDEPAAGLSEAEGRRLAVHLRALADDGAAVLVIDHDMGFVLGLCDEVAVLDFGRLIERGSPQQIRASAAVAEAYLGVGDADADAPAQAPPQQIEVVAEPTVLAVEGLHAGYDGLDVVHGIDLRVGAGEVVALLGANGAGKTTTLLAISGLVSARGVVRVGDTDVKGWATEKIARAGVAHVPENRELFGELTVAENLRLAARSREELARVLAIFPALAAISGRRASVLSGGEQQMLAIARGLAMAPRLLMIDEMSLGLAPLIVEQLLATLREVALASGCGVLLVEQHVHRALDVADRAYLLADGRVTAQGPAAAMRDEIGELTAGYLGDDDLLTQSDPSRSHA